MMIQLFILFFLTNSFLWSIRTLYYDFVDHAHIDAIYVCYVIIRMAEYFSYWASTITGILLPVIYVISKIDILQDFNFIKTIVHWL